MTVQRLQAHYGFTRMPFGANLAPGMLHRYTGHGEAVARLTWCVDQHALGVITGEVGAGKTVAVRAATAALDNSRHVIIYLPNPSVGVRGMLHHIVAALGQVPSFYTATLAPQAADALAAEHAERGRTPVLVIDFSTRFLRVVHVRGPTGKVRAVRSAGHLSGTGSQQWVGTVAMQPDLSNVLRVQVANHPGGQRSYVVLNVSTGAVHRRAERFLAGFGEGTQRTYAYHLVDHLRWLAVCRYREDTVGIGDLRRYMALCGTEFAGPLGTAWRATPLSRNAQRVRAACVKGYYLDVTTREGVNEPLRAALSARRSVTGRDRDRSSLGHLATSMASNPLSHGAPPRRHPRLLPEGAAAERRRTNSLDPAVRSALPKLVQALPEVFRADARAAATAVVVDSTPWGQRDRVRPERVDELRDAVVTGRKVSLQYENRLHQRTRRVVDPWGLIDKDDIWYLLAGTETGQRTFRVDRIIEATVTDLVAQRPSDVKLARAWDHVVEEMEQRRSLVWATVLIAAHLLPVLRTQFGRHCEPLNPHSDGRAQIRVTAPTALSIAEQLAGWGATLEVLEPETVKTELARLGAELVQRYPSR